MKNQKKGPDTSLRQLQPSTNSIMSQNEGNHFNHDMFVWLCAIALMAIALIIDHQSRLMASLFAACGLVFAVYGIVTFFKPKDYRS